MASIFVKDLHANVTESTLYQKFSSIGPLLSLRVCRDAESNRSLGYAYVNFVDRNHANRAIKTMNFELLEGRPIQVVRSEKNPLLRNISEPNIFVKNLDKSVTNRELFYAFSQFGKVVSCKVTKDQNGISKCYGFVQLEDDESAMRSILQLNGLMVKNKILCVQRFTTRKIKGSNLTEDSKQSFTNIYVKNIGKDLCNQGLRDMFEKFGRIASPKIMTESDGTSRGFGFVSFESSDAAYNAVLQMNGKQLPNGQFLYVCRAQKKKEREQEMQAQKQEYGHDKGNLCVSNLDDDVDEVRLRKEFLPYGTVITTKVIMKHGRSTGIGYVCFSAPDDAVKAIAAMNGRILGTKPIIVYPTEGVKPSFGENRLFSVRPRRPHLLEITNTTMKNGITAKRNPDMSMVFRMLSPHDAEKRTISFECT